MDAINYLYIKLLLFYLNSSKDKVSIHSEKFIQLLDELVYNVLYNNKIEVKYYGYR